MKFVLVNDLKKIIKSLKIWIILYYVIFISFMCFNYFINMSLINESYVIESFGLVMNNVNLLKVIISVFHIFFYIYLAIFLFFQDLKKGMCNLFLRLDNRKWLIYKIISIIAITSLLELSVFSIITFFIFVVSRELQLFFNILLVNLLFIVSCQIYAITSIIYLPCSSSYLFMVLLVFYAQGNVTRVNVLVEIALLILNIIIGIILVKKKRIIIFEKC